MDRTINVLTLAFLALIERMSYYGMRALIVLYLIDESGLGLVDEDVLSYYGWFTFFIYFLPMPIGLISDKLLNTKKGILIGGVISFFGYSLLTVQSSFTGVIIACCLIAIGIGFVKPNSVILLGRLYNKLDNKRDYAFLIFYLFINFGALLSTLVIGYVGEVYNWTYGFAITSLLSLVFVTLFILTSNKFVEIETNELLEVNSKVNTRNITLGIIGLLILTIVFWHAYELVQNIILGQVLESGDQFLFNFEISTSFVYGISSFFSVLILIILIVYGSLKEFRKTYLKLGIASILVGLVSLFFLFFDQVEPTFILELSLLPLFIIGISEVLFSSFSLSFLTRISDVNYSATIYGVFFGIVGLMGMALGGISFSYEVELVSFISIIIGIAIIVFRKKVGKFYFGF